MKKKILFVIPSLWSGGAEKSFITLASLFDFDKYDVDLFTFRHDGLFSEKLPKEINYINNSYDYEKFDSDIKTSLKYFLRKFKFLTAVERITYTKIFSEPDIYEMEVKLWNVLKKRLPKTQKKYDCAISYLENFAANYVAEIVDADKKFCFIHTDFKKYEHDHRFFGEKFEKFDTLITVSETCCESLAEEYPHLSQRCTVIENITSRKIVCEDAKSDAVYPEKTDGEIRILTVGRMAAVKNIGLAVGACDELKHRGRNIKWYHIGMGELKEEIQKQIEDLQLKNDFILLGERSNPYPYMDQCDIYVQPSSLEGKSIAIEEVKCLSKAIVVTNFPTAFSQINDGANGFICEQNKNDMADKIETLIDNPELRNLFSENLKKEQLGNEQEIQKLYTLIES